MAARPIKIESITSKDCKLPGEFLKKYLPTHKNNKKLYKNRIPNAIKEKN